MTATSQSLKPVHPLTSYDDAHLRTNGCSGRTGAVWEWIGQGSMQGSNTYSLRPLERESGCCRHKDRCKDVKRVSIAAISMAGSGRQPVLS